MRAARPLDLDYIKAVEEVGGKEIPMLPDAQHLGVGRR